MIPTDVPVSDDLVLRAWHVDDADDVAAACSDPLTLRFLPMLPDPYKREHALWWITEGVPATFEAGGAAYAIADAHSRRVLGAIGLTRVHSGTAGVGYWVAPWARRRGVASAATRVLASRALRQGAAPGQSPGLSRLELHTDWENTASQRVAIAAGFTREAVARGIGQRRDGGRSDRIIWVRLATDPPGPARRLLPDLPGDALTDGVVTLRPLRPEDAEDTYHLRSLPDVITSSVPPVPPDRDRVDRMCSRTAAMWLAGERVNLTIRDAASDTYAGEVGLYYQEPTTGQAMIGYSLIPAWRGRGYATRAVRLLAGWAFDELGLPRLIAGTAPENLGSQRVLDRAGFQREGYQRSRLPGVDGRIDDILYARLREDPAV